jgi:hypothetical protein
VRSHRGTQFRQWATEQLREFLVKGFVMDDERLKNPPGSGQRDPPREAAKTMTMATSNPDGGGKAASVS